MHTVFDKDEDISVNARENCDDGEIRRFRGFATLHSDGDTYAGYLARVTRLTRRWPDNSIKVSRQSPCIT